MRVVIADDTLLVRSGLSTLLTNAGIEVLAAVGDADQVIDAVQAKGPDAVIVDIRMPPTFTDEGLIAAQRIRRDSPAVAVLVLSQYLESSYALRLLADDPSSVGYLLKDRVSDAATLTDALRRIVAGECVVDPAIVRRLVRRGATRGPLSDLTDREHDVLALISEGRSNQSICDRLGLSPKTVETHIGRVFAKLGLEGSAQAHRRVLAVLTYLRHGQGRRQTGTSPRRPLLGDLPDTARGSSARWGGPDG